MKWKLGAWTALAAVCLVSQAAWAVEVETTGAAIVDTGSKIVHGGELRLLVTELGGTDVLTSCCDADCIVTSCTANCPKAAGCECKCTFVGIAQCLCKP